MVKALGEESQDEEVRWNSRAGGETVVPYPLILIPQDDKGTAQHTDNSAHHSRLAMVKLDQLESALSLKWV